MSNIAEMIKTNPDAFDYQDCRPGGEERDSFWAGFQKKVDDGLSDDLKKALEAREAATSQNARSEA